MGPTTKNATKVDKDLPESNSLTVIPINSNLRELQKKSSLVGSVILEALSVKSDNIDQLGWVITHHSPHPDSGSFESLDQIQCSNSESLIIIGGELILSDHNTNKSYPPGYIIQNWKDWKDQSKRKYLNLSEEGVTLLKIPRADLQDLIKEDPNFSAAVIHIMNQVHPKRKFSDTERELLRSVRDEVLQALSTRDAFLAISGTDGIISILNPKKLDLDRKNIRIHSNELEEEGDFPCSTIEQSWKLVNPISMLLLGDRGIKTVLEIKAREIRARAEKENPDSSEQEITEIAFKDYRFYLRRKRVSSLNNLSPAFHNFCEYFQISEDNRLLLSKRVFQIYWLVSEAKNSGHDIVVESERELNLTFSKNMKKGQDKSDLALKEVKDGLDSIIEKLFNLLQSEKIPGLRGARIRKLDRAISIEDPDLLVLPKDHWVYRNLADLNRRLVEGDKSVVGGTYYQERRWPQSLHPFVFDGSIKVVFCDGALGDGIRWIRRNFGVIPGTETYQALTFKILKGEYGDFPQCFITFENGQKFWLISFDGGGIGRPFSNAMAIRLQAEEKDVQDILNDFIFLEQPTPIKDRLSEALSEIIEHSERDLANCEVLGQVIDSPEELPTQLVILHHSDGLIESAGNDKFLQKYPSKSLHEVSILYWKDEQGRIIRNIIVPVGGKGLYHESAGAMVEAFLTHPRIANPIRHIYFSAQAGLISNTEKVCSEVGFKGVGDVDPGGLIVPQSWVISAYGNESKAHQIPTLLTDEFLQSDNPDAQRLIRFIESNEIFLTSNHIGVSCPADETEKDLSRKVEEHKASSVDVECFFCVEAANRCGAKITIVNYASDVISIEIEKEVDLYNTLAFHGALQSGSKADPIQAQMAYLVLKAIQHEELKAR